MMVDQQPPTQPDPMALKPTPTAPHPSLSTKDANNTNASTTATVEDVVTLPTPKKPRIEFNRDEFKFSTSKFTPGAGDLRSRLNAFMPALRAADQQLQNERISGRIAERRMEIDSSSSEEDDSDSAEDESEEDDEDEEDEDDDASNKNAHDASADGERGSKAPEQQLSEALIASLLSAPFENPADKEDNTNDPPNSSKRKKKKKGTGGQYIEMNLGLGVLEELKPTDNDPDTNERRQLIDRILELRRIQDGGRADEDSDEETESSGTLNLTANKGAPLQEDRKLLKGIGSDNQGVGGKKKKKVVIEELE